MFRVGKVPCGVAHSEESISKDEAALSAMVIASNRAFVVFFCVNPLISELAVLGRASTGVTTHLTCSWQAQSRYISAARDPD